MDSLVRRLPCLAILLNQHTPTPASSPSPSAMAGSSASSVNLVAHGPSAAVTCTSLPLVAHKLASRGSAVGLCISKSRGQALDAGAFFNCSFPSLSCASTISCATSTRFCRCSRSCMRAICRASRRRTQAPNPSIERTHNGKAQWRASATPSAPLRSAHVER